MVELSVLKIEEILAKKALGLTTRELELYLEGYHEGSPQMSVTNYFYFGFFPRLFNPKIETKGRVSPKINLKFIVYKKEFFNRVSDWDYHTRNHPLD